MLKKKFTPHIVRTLIDSDSASQRKHGVEELSDDRERERERRGGREGGGGKGDEITLEKRIARGGRDRLFARSSDGDV